MTQTNTVRYPSAGLPFYYLAGPMTDYPQHNFPRFIAVAKKLTAAELCIVSPADLDQPIHDEVMRGDGSQAHLRSDSPLGFELLRRDVNIVMDPNCIGVICLEGWEESRGALIETFVGSRWERKLLAYFDDDSAQGFHLVAIPDRDRHLELYYRQQTVSPWRGTVTGRMSCKEGPDVYDAPTEPMSLPTLDPA